MKFDHCFVGDCRDSMREMLSGGYAGKVQCIVTSPPYWGLRDYGVAGQIGVEPEFSGFLHHLADVFGLCYEMLADDGTLWINMGDSYAVGKEGLKSKDLVGQPWRLAFALQDAGWYLRQDIIWHKPNPMPESVRDRCTKAHEYLFLLTKRERYYFDQDAIKEPSVSFGDYKMPDGWDTGDGAHGSFHRNGRGKGRVPGNVNPAKGQKAYELGDTRHRTKSGLLDYAKKYRKQFDSSQGGGGTSFNGHSGYFKADGTPIGTPGYRNKRSVWTIPTEAFHGAHFATFPQALVEPCILAGSRPGDIVFDPFLGSGTVAQVAQQLGRRWIGCEINQSYVGLQQARTKQFGLVLEAG